MQNIKLSVLTRNELIKIKARKINVVFAAILLALTLLSFCNYVLLSSYGYEISTLDEAEYYLSRAEDIKNGDTPYDSFFDRETVPVGLAVLEMNEYARLYRYAYDLGIKDSNDWRYNIFYNRMISAATANIVVDQIENGKEYAEYIWDCINGKTSDCRDFTFDDFKRMSEECDEYSVKLRDMRYADHIGELYAQKQTDYTEYKKTADLQGDSSEAEIMQHRIRCEFYEAALYAYKYIVDNDLDFNDAMAKQAVNIVQYTENRYGDLTVYEYGYDTSRPNTDSYNEYLDGRRSTFDEYRTELKTGRYCLDHSVYDVAASGDARTAANAFFGNFSTLYIFALIIFSTVAASEFSPKTVNMLLIRPVSRKKIMQSKFYAATITAISVYSACLVLHIALTLITTGGGDFLQPIFIDFFGNITAITYPIHMLFEFICCCASSVMLGTLALMFATLTRNSAAGTLLGIASTMFSTVSSLIVMLYSAVAYAVFPLTYTAIWEHIGLGITCTPSYYEIYNLFNMFFGADTRNAGNIAYGLIINLLLTALWLFCALSNFKRRDI